MSVWLRPRTVGIGRWEMDCWRNEEWGVVVELRLGTLTGWLGGGGLRGDFKREGGRTLSAGGA